MEKVAFNREADIDFVAEYHNMKGILDSIDAGIWQLNVQTGEQSVNNKWAEILGYTLEELSPVDVKTWKNNIYKEDLEKVEKNIEKVYAGEADNYNIEFRMVHKDGSLVWINSRGKVNSWTENGKPLITSGIHIDINIQKKLELELIESEERYRSLFTFESDALFVIDKETGDILEANDSACTKYGYSREELLKLKNTDMSAEPKMTRKATAEFTEGSTLIPMRYHKKKDGTVFPVEITASFIKMKEREVHLIASRDITERIKAEREINFLSYHDQLTGLYNRRFYEEELKRLDVKRNLPLTLVMGDVNGLKLVNDSFGHTAGDELLVRVAEVLRNACRSDDIIARIGGDEFVIILPRTDTAGTTTVINRIKDLASKSNVGVNTISISFGYETKINVSQRIEDVFNDAEDHMYKHKLFESERVKHNMIDLIMKTLYEKNERELRHSIRVSEICQKISTSMKFPKELINQVRMAGLMHDIGKISVDEKVLNQLGKLKSGEWKDIKKHPEIGYHILNASSEFSEMAVFVLEHHERWDGAGYPKGLKGSEITLAARIIAAAEAFDAMITEDGYGRSFTVQEALEELKRCSGTQFDPEIVAVFLENFK